MRWEIYPISEFSKLQDTWDSLNQRSFKTPLLDSRFINPLIACFSTGEEKIVVFGHFSAPEAMGIVTKSKTGSWSTFQPSQAPVGAWLQSQAFDISRDMPGLFKELPSTTVLIGITQQDPVLVERPEKAGKVSTIDYIETARIPVCGDFERYWASRGKNLRQNLKRQRNRLQREGIKTELRVVSEPGSMSASVFEYGELESRGWKNNEGTAIRHDNDQGIFYSRLLKNFSQSNQAIVFKYLYNDVLTAMDLCIFDDNNLVILKTTYDEDITTSSPAMLMRQDSFRHIFDKQLAKNIEFYGKVMDWHKRWADDIRTLYHVNFTRNRLSKIILRK
jgi:GNAT acetyltransferase-like protein